MFLICDNVYISQISNIGMANGEDSPAMRNFKFQRIIAIVGALLMIGKFLAYFITNSVAILTDALESIVNVAAGIIGLYALYLTMQPADDNHPYGHGKVELISSSVEGSMIMIAGALIIFESVQRIIEGDYTLRSLDIGLLIVALAAAANFAMGYTAIRMGRSSNSVALEASGKHLCSDTVSSVGILLGLGVVYVLAAFGIEAYWIDPLMALAFGAVIIVTGIRVLFKSMNGIMDSADMDVIKDVTKCINHVRNDNVIDVHHLRVNRYGVSVHIDAHMTVPCQLTVCEAEAFVEEFRKEVCKTMPGDVDITFMAEGCDKTHCKHCPRDCPNRTADFTGRQVLGTQYVIRSGRKKKKEFGNFRKDQ